MKISIISAVRNNPGVGRALESVFAQKVEAEVESVVIDGASTDGTLAVLERYRPRLGVLLSEPDGGIYHAMNKGIARATGDIVGMLNSDDVYTTDRVLSRVLEAFAQTDADAVYGDLVYVRGKPGRVLRYWRSCAYSDGLFEKGWMPPHPTFFVRRSVYAAHGGFDTRYRIAADFELLLRLLARVKIRSTYVPEVLVRMQTGGVSNRSPRNVLRANVECYRACKHHGLDVLPWFILRKVLWKIPQFFDKSP